MPARIPVELCDHDPAWTEQAQQEIDRILAAVGTSLVTVHHIGSTSIAGLRAKPIVDLVPVFTTEPEMDAARETLETLGYAWWGEYGLPGRRYCTWNDPTTNRRLRQLHCYVQGSTEIRRHLAFRDYLRARPDLAREYEVLKEHCRQLHPGDSHAYSDCKGEWIRRIEAEALSVYPAD